MQRWTLAKKGSVTTKYMGRYKVEPLAQHDSMQPYELELVSYNTSCPHYKMRFHQVAFHEKSKDAKPKRHLFRSLTNHEKPQQNPHRIAEGSYGAIPLSVPHPVHGHSTPPSFPNIQKTSKNT